MICVDSGVQTQVARVDTKTQLSIQKEQEIVYSRAKPKNPWPGNTSLGYPQIPCSNVEEDSRRFYSNRTKKSQKSTKHHLFLRLEIHDAPW